MKTAFFKSLSGLIGIYHVILGVIGLILPIETVVKAFGVTLGVTLEINNQLTYIAKFTSAYIFVFGLAALILASNPIKYRSFAGPIAALFGIRFISRIVFFTALTSTFGMSAMRNIIGSALILFCCLGIWLARPSK